MQRMINTTVRFSQNTCRLWFALFLLAGPSSAFAYQCGNGNNNCSLNQLASFLDRIKPRFETQDLIYDQIYSEGDNTLVFIQRIKRRMDLAQREFVIKHGAIKQASLPELCTDKDLLPVLQQGLILKYVVQDVGRNTINTFAIEYNDCVSS